MRLNLMFSVNFEASSKVLGTEEVQMLQILTTKQYYSIEILTPLVPRKRCIYFCFWNTTTEFEKILKKCILKI